MGISEIYDIVYAWFVKAFDESWLYIAAIVIIIGGGGLLIAGTLLIILNKGDSPPAPDPDRVFIEANAPGYCQERGFNAWRYKENVTTPQFECFIQPNETMSIEKYLNMT